MKKSFLAAIFSIFLVSCAGGKLLRTEPVKSPREASGTFTLILHGGNYADDIETMAILDLEGDAYQLKPFAPEFDYKVLKGLTAKEAVEEAVHHAGFHPSASAMRWRRILGETGVVIGYELRPLYMSFVYGESDVLDVDYWLREGGSVRVYIRLKARVLRRRTDEIDLSSPGR